MSEKKDLIPLTEPLIVSVAQFIGLKIHLNHVMLPIKNITKKINKKSTKSIIYNLVDKLYISYLGLSY